MATKFRFASNPHLPVDHSYQVQRAEFDKLLLDNSRRLGATILEATRAREVEFDVGERTRITATGPTRPYRPGWPGMWLMPPVAIRCSPANSG